MLPHPDTVAVSGASTLPLGATLSISSSHCVRNHEMAAPTHQRASLRSQIWPFAPCDSSSTSDVEPSASSQHCSVQEFSAPDGQVGAHCHRPVIRRPLGLPLSLS